MFDLEELSMKMERVTDSENVDFCVRPFLGGVSSACPSLSRADQSRCFGHADPLLRLDEDAPPPI